MNNTDSNKKNKVGRPFIPAEERKDYKVTIRVDKEFKDELQRFADKENLTIAEYIRIAIESYNEKIKDN